LISCGCDDATRTSTDRDNTAINQRDQNDSAKTPMDQSNNQKDIDTTAEIRKQILDSGMSINAQNVKIITDNGKVTLRGPVETAEEKQKIETIAQNVAGATNVDSQLEVKN
jgi:osmotically-inducible protein OsmY